MAEWWQGSLCALDFETNAPNPEAARVVTAAIAFCGEGKGTVTHRWLADAGGEEIPAEAEAIHGVSTERARSEGRPAAEVIDEVMAVLAERPPDCPVVIFNAKYDVTVLDREARRYGLNPGEWVPGPVVDPFVIDRWLCRYRRGSRKLDALCIHYGVVLDDAHDAASDALAAARLAWVIGSRGEVVRRVRNADDGRELARLKREWADVKGDLDRLHAAQVRWAKDQADGLRDYFIRKCQLEDAASVRPDWPLIPLPVAEAA